MVEDAAVGAAADRVLSRLSTDPRYGCTSHLLVRVAGRVLVDEHLQGPVRGEVFSITKSVLATEIESSSELLPSSRSSTR